MTNKPNPSYPEKIRPKPDSGKIGIQPKEPRPANPIPPRPTPPLNKAAQQKDQPHGIESQLAN
jgi:hypothetical protein